MRGEFLRCILPTRRLWSKQMWYSDPTRQARSFGSLPSQMSRSSRTQSFQPRLVNWQVQFKRLNLGQFKLKSIWKLHTFADSVQQSVRIDDRMIILDNQMAILTLSPSNFIRFNAIISWTCVSSKENQIFKSSAALQLATRISLLA